MSVEAQVEVVLEDGSSRRVRVGSAPVVVGSGSSADVALPSHPDVLPEHARLEAREEGCAAQPAAGATVLVSGQPWAGGVVPWGSELTVGPSSLRLERRETRAPSEQSQVSPVVLIAALVTVAAVWMLLSDGAEPVGASPPVEPPTLFDATTTCPEGSGPTRHRADLDAHAASAKSERYPFAPQDGVRAVVLYRQAARCYEAAGDSGRAGELDDRAAELADRVDEDYRTARFRLERALEQERLADALAETRQLRALLSHRSGPYVEWLGELERRLELAQSREGT